MIEQLVRKGFLKKEDAEAIMTRTKGSISLIEKELAEKGVAAEEILKAKGEFLNMPVRSISAVQIPSNILDVVPEDAVRFYKFIPIGMKEGVLEIGIVDPDNIEARDALNFIVAKQNIPYKLFLISSADYEEVLAQYKGLSGEVSQALSELETELSDVELGEADEELVASVAKEAVSGDNTTIIEEAPVKKIVATIVRHATQENASDVHIEPMRDRFRIRFRVDGVLYTSTMLPIKVHPAVVARIKILCNMKLDEKRKPQDGRFSANINGVKIDFRVSTMPTYWGEKVVMRILNPEVGVKTLEKLGLTERNVDMVKTALNRPYGMVLITGPTGSGKSTTLYSMLNMIDHEEMNVVSLEDPIEYNVEGVSQSQVRADIGYTFANGLRSILRQDPDVIMVGEIRDKETAALAIQAALTGHLVFSTLHTNNAAGIVPRLIDMGIDPYLIAPTLILGMAQRLVATFPEGGGEEVVLEGALKALVDKQFEDLPPEFRKGIPTSNVVYRPKPMPNCPGGLKGRMAVHEMFTVDKDIESLIMKRPGEQDMYKFLRAKGFITMREDALVKSFNRQVPFEEVNRL